MSKQLIFKAKTDEAHICKILSEVLQNILTDVCFELDKNGIKLSTVDNKQPPTLMVNLSLNKDRFKEYICKKPQIIGISLQHLYKMLKSIKRKDQLELSISADTPKILDICVITHDTNQKVKSSIKIQGLQKIGVDLVEYTVSPNLIPTTNFQKMCKDMNSISKIIKIYSKGSFIEFSCNIDNLYARAVPFGELTDSDGTEYENPEYEDVFVAKTLSQLLKISGLNNKMRIYTQLDHPLKLSVDVGTLGVIDIFIKSKNQLEAETETD